MTQPAGTCQRPRPLKLNRTCAAMLLRGHALGRAWDSQAVPKRSAMLPCAGEGRGGPAPGRGTHVTRVWVRAADQGIDVHGWG